jgi:hypothetical protein
MKTLSSILILFVAFSFGNAQDITVNADYDRNADFSKYETFSIMDREDETSQRDLQRDPQEGETGREEGIDQPGMAEDRDMEQRETEARDRDQGITEGTGRDRAQGAVEAEHHNKGSYGAGYDEHGLEQAIKSELEEKGLQHTESNPDLLVNYHVFDGSSDFVMGMGTTRYSAWGPNIMQEDIANIREGSVVIHIVDAEQNQLVYQAISESPNGLDRESVEKVVSNIFEDFGNLVHR